MKPYNSMQLFVLDRNTCYHITVCKKIFKKQLHKKFKSKRNSLIFRNEITHDWLTCC